MTFPLPGANWTYLHGLTRKAATPESGFALQDSTPNILSWTAPDDGRQHVALIFATAHVTSAETGGQVVTEYTLPDGTVADHTLFTPDNAAGDLLAGQWYTLVVGPGTQVKIFQNSALTAGAAVLWAEIWGL